MTSETPPDQRRHRLQVKSTKLNDTEYDREDGDSWIQNMEQYFDSSKTMLEHRT